jgi:hypothetical protein
MISATGYKYVKTVDPPLKPPRNSPKHERVAIQADFGERDAHLDVCGIHARQHFACQWLGCSA